MRWRKVVLKIFLCGFASCSMLMGQTQVAKSSDISVHYVFPKLTVVVSQSSSLQSVLKELCQQTQAECSGIEQTAGYNVASSTLRGTWSEVVDQLMEGTALNYAAGPPSASLAGRLIIQGQRVALPPPANVPPQDFNNATMASVPTMASTSPVSTASDNTMSNQGPVPNVGVAPGTGAPSFGAFGGARASSGAMPGTFGNPLTSEMPSNQSTEFAEFQPFPDAHGNLIPTSKEPAQYLPFPDAHGNLIPVKPNDPGGSPFPASAILSRH